MEEFKTKDMVIQFTTTVIKAHTSKERSHMIYANLLGLLENFINIIRYEIEEQRLTKDLQVVGLFNFYHEKWKKVTKGVNHNLGVGTMKYDGLKSYLCGIFPDHKKMIEEKLI